jgi:hypothetical protein
MAVKFANLASSTLSGAITNSATSITVSDASSFPTLGSGDYFYASLGEGTGSEIVKVTAVSTNTFTVTRAQDGTSAQAWSSGTVIALRVVAAALDDIASQAQTAADTESVSISGDTMTGDLTAPNVTATSKVKGASLETDRYIYHAGDTNTYIDFGDDEINFHAGGGANQERLRVLASKIDANVAIYGPDGHPLAQFFSTTSAGYFGSTNRSNLTLASSNRPQWRNGNGNYADIVVDGLDASLSSTTISNTAVSSTPLIIGSSSQTNYTQFSIKTDVHDAEAYLIAYGSNHVSEANNFAMKNLQSGGNIFFELASSVKPLTLESTGATFAGNVTVQGDNLDITQSIRHRGDEHTGINFFSDQVVIKTGGYERLNITNSDINIKNTQVFFNSTMGIGASTYAPIENNVDSERNWLNFHRSNNASYVEFTNRTPLGKIVLSGGLDGGGGEVQRLEIEGGSATKSVKVLASTNLNLSSTSKLTHGSSTIIDASRNIESVGTISTDVAMSSSPYLHHFAVSGTNTVGGGAGIVFQTSATAGSRTQFGAKIQGVRSSSDDGSADLEFYTSKAASGAHRLVLTLDEDKDAAFTGNVALDGDLSVKNGQLILGTANTSSGHINAYELMTFNIDTDNDDTNRYFKWTTNSSSGSGSQLMYLDESGNLTVSGNFTVQGTTTTLDTATLQVEDKNIVLNYGTGDTSGSADGAGITIQDAVSASTDATLTWNSTNDEFISSHPVQINRTTAGGELLHLYNTYDGGYRDDLLIENTNDRDVGITLKNSVAQYEIWMDGANDDSLIFSPGDNTSVIAMEVYQNKNVDIGGNLQVTGDIETLKGIEFNPNGHSISADSDGNRTLFDFYRSGSIHWQVYHDGNGHLDFIPTNTAYKLKWNSNELLYSGANISVGTVASGVHTITGTGTIGGAYAANGYLKVTDGTDTLALDSNEVHSTDRLFINSEDGEIYLRGYNNAGAKLFNGGTQFMSADRNLLNIGTISSGAITASSTIANVSSGHAYLILKNGGSHESGMILQKGSANKWEAPYISNANDNLKFYSYTGSSLQLEIRDGVNGNGGTILSGLEVSDGNAYYGSYGALLLNSNQGYTSTSRGWMVTNAYEANKFALLYSNSATTLPALTTYGAAASGTSVALEIDNAGNATFSGDATVAGQIDVLDGTAEFVISGDSSGNNYLKSSGEIRVRPSGTTVNKLVIGSNGNITTAGYISASEQSVFTGNSISGTPNSNAQLVAADSGVAGIAIQTNDGGSSYVWFGDTTDNAVGRIRYDHSADEFTFRAGATDDVFEIDSSGMGKLFELTLKGGSDNLTFTETGGDWSIKNAQQNNGIVIYDGSGGVEIHYNNAAVAEFDSAGGMNIVSGELRMGGTTRIGNGGTATFAGVNIINSGMPTLTLYDNGNGGGGAAEAKIEFTNTAGTAVAIGYTDDQSGDTDLIISTNAAGTYGGYLGLTAAAIADAQSDIILEPKTDVRIATGGLKVGTSQFITSSRALENVTEIQVGSLTNQNQYGKLQVNQAANNDESGIGILDSTNGRSMRLWCDSTTSYINSGNGGSGNLVFNEAVTVSSGGNLSGVGTISSGAITTSGELVLDKQGTATSTTTTYNSQSLSFRASGWDTNNNFARTVTWRVRHEPTASVYPDHDLVFSEISDGSTHSKFVLHGRGTSGHVDPKAATFYGNVDVEAGSGSGAGDGSLNVQGDITTGSNPSNGGAIYIHDTSTTAYTLGILATGTRGYKMQGSASSADYSLTMENAGTGAFNLTVEGGLTTNGAHTLNATGVDFIVQDTDDTVTNYIWRQHSTDKLYLGSQNAVVDLRSALKISDTERIDMSGNATFGSISASSDVTVTGARITINDNTDALRLRSQTNGVGVNINFSDQYPTPSQQGNINYVHSDSASYGSENAFILSSTESSMTVLADGKLMFKEGLYSKPSTGTGAGTLLISSSGTITSPSTISATGQIKSETSVSGTVTSQYAMLLAKHTEAGVQVIAENSGDWAAWMGMTSGSRHYWWHNAPTTASANAGSLELRTSTTTSASDVGGQGNGSSVLVTVGSTGLFTVDNDIKTNSRVGIGSVGSTSAPSIYLNTDTDTGIYWPASDQLGFVAGGAERVRVTSDGIETRSGKEIRAYRADNARSTRVYTDNSYGYLETDTDPLMIKSANRIEFRTNGNDHRFSISNGGTLEIGSANTAILTQNRDLQNINSISSGAITATGASSFTDLALGGAADANYDLKVYGLARFQGVANFTNSIQTGGFNFVDSSRNIYLGNSTTLRTDESRETIADNPILLQNGTDLPWGSVVPQRPIPSIKTYAEAGNIGTNSTNYPDVYGEADLSGITGDATFTWAQAMQKAQELGGRLPTLEEVMSGSGAGSGQGYDSHLLWTQTPAGRGKYWAVQGSYSGTTNAEITDESTALRIRVFFDTTRNYKPVHYDYQSAIRTNTLKAANGSTITAAGQTFAAEVGKFDATGTTAAACKLHVGQIQDNTSSAIAQFGGFVRFGGALILHNGSASGNQTHIEYAGDDLGFTTTSGSASGAIRTNGYKIGSGGSTVINSSREAFFTNLTLDSSADAALTINDNMTSAPARIHFNMTGTTTVGGGGAVLFETSTSGTDAIYNARIEGIRTSSDNGSSEINFWTTSVATSANAAKRVTITETGNLTVTGNVTAYASDERLKENIALISDPIEKVKRLQGVEFDWRSDCTDKGFIPSMPHETGVIAQNVQSVIPDAVTPAKFDADYLTVDKSKLVAVLIEAVKAQQEQIDSLNKRIEELENGNN